LNVEAMTTVEIQVPEAVLISLKEMPESIVQELRMLAAVKLFELGKLSSGRAAELAGLSRVAFLMALGRYCVSPLQLADDELAQDIDHA
jgi:predicted HTH domain antitoxin